jgi:hypothetical protein
MSEKIFALLLRFYPSYFREAYTDEAMQLFRDRARNERGLFRQFRLWLDLFADLAGALLREYCRFRPAFATASVARHTDGAPSFYILDDESPRAGTLIFAGALSLIALSGFSALITEAGSSRQHRASKGTIASAGAQVAALRNSSALLAGNSDAEVLTPGPLPVSSAVPAQRSVSQGAGSLWIKPSNEADLDAVERRRVTNAVIMNIDDHYFDQDAARKITDALLTHEKNGDYDSATSDGAFAELLTRQLRDVSHDMHLEVVYSQAAIPDRPPGPPPDALERYRKAMEEENCTFRKVEVLPHNIGYLKLDSFPDPSICRSTAVAAMASLNHSNALIFDLRDNGGGYPAMVSLVAAYLFDHPEYMYNPRENPTERSWTQSPVPGNLLADKPVYVLTSATTISGAEQFSYDLKMLKRATLVGETTRGGAHAGVWHRIDDHFGIAIPELKAINPYSKTDWEGTGVEPDVKVKAADALMTAEKLAERKEKK